MLELNKVEEAGLVHDHVRVKAQRIFAFLENWLKFLIKDFAKTPFFRVV